MARLLAQFFLLVLSVFFLWAGGMVWFALDHEVPPPIHQWQKNPADAIVVLTGGSERLETGFDLLAKGLGREMFISGVHKDVMLDELLVRGPDHVQNLRSRITMGKESHNTTGNVLETVAWMKENEYTTLILVTSDYHMPRSMLFFDLHAPSLNVQPWSVITPDIDTVSWWKKHENLLLMMREYNKFLLSYIPSKLLTGLAQ